MPEDGEEGSARGPGFAGCGSDVGFPLGGAAESNHTESCFEGTKTEAVGLAGGDEREGTGVSCAHVPRASEEKPSTRLSLKGPR